MIKRADFRLTPVALALRNAGLLIFALTLAPGAADAQVPTGGVVTQGRATITNVSPTQQRIVQGTDKAVINWQNFSIGAPNAVTFVQPGSSSVVLNRVVSGTPSSILGGLSANGQVFLVNPNGIYFGPNAVVDVTGIVATTLNIRDSDFMAGRYIFGRDPASPERATVINDGTIRALPGGYVVLAGDYAANSGIIEARLGTALLAAAGRITLDITGDNLINFAISEQTLKQLAGVSNSGQVLADGGRVVMTASVARDLSATVVNNTGIVQARGTVERDGAIYLTADGGDVVSTGRLDASGPRGGQIVAQSVAGTTLVSGNVDASGSSGAGGKVQLLGERVGVTDNASIDVSGRTGGGTALIGGDFQGNNTAVQNAQRTFVGPGTLIAADARESGNGGKVIVWSDDITRYYGDSSARGGSRAGNGGNVEVSGKGFLDFNGTVTTLAPQGATGTLLLDPKNLTVAIAGGAAYVAGANNLFANNVGATTILTPASIVAAAAASNITLQANNDITFTDALALTTAGRSLTAQAGRNINVNANVSTTDGAITLTANDAGANAADRGLGTGNITLGAGTAVNSGSAATTLNAGAGAISGTGSVTQTAGTLTLNAGAGINAVTAAPTVAFSNTSGAVTISNTRAAGLTVAGTNSGAVSITETTGALAVGAAGIATGGNSIALNSNGTVTQAGTLSGSSLSTTSKGGTTLNAANTVTQFNGTNSVSGNVALTNTAGTLTIAGVNQTGGGSVTIANTGAITTSGAISTAANGDISITATGGTLTINNATTAGGTGNVTLATTGVNNIAVNSSVGGASNNVFLDSGGAITGGGTITADGLALKTGTGGIGSVGTPLAVSANKLAAQAPASIFVAKSAGTLAIGGVGIIGSPTGVSTTAANGDISISAPILNVNEAIVPNGTGTTTLSADNFALNAAISGSTVTLQPKTTGTAFTLGLGATGAGLSQAELLNVTAGTLRIGSSASTAGTVTFDGDLTLTATQGALSINSTGAVTQAANTKIVTPGGFAAQTGAASVTLNEVNNDLRTVAINTTGDVTLRNLNPFSITTVDGIKGIHANNVTLTTGLPTTGSVASVATFTNATTLTVTSAAGLAVGDRILIAGAGPGGTDLVTTITGIAGTTITFASKTTGAINIATDAKSLTVASAAGLNVNDQIAIAGAGDAGATLTTTITAIAGTTLTLATGATTTVAGVDVIKGRAASTIVAGAAVTRLATTGTIAQTSTSLTVASTSGLAIGDRIIVPGAGANGKDLATTIANIVGNTITLANAAVTTVTNAYVAKPTFIGGAPTTGTASASSTTLTVASGAGYAIGDAILVAGAGASGADLATTVAGIAGNTITLGAAAQTAVTNANVYHTDQSIIATGTVSLDSKIPSGYTQTGGSLTASQFALRGYGPYNLNGTGSANHVTTLAGDVTGGISYVDTGAITIGTVAGLTGLTTRSMLTSPASASTMASYSDANISLSTNATSSLAAGTTAMSITQPIRAGVKNTPDPADDATPLTDRTGQLLLFLVADTKAVTSGAGNLESSLLNLSAELGKGTFDLKSNVGSLLLNGSKDATVDNTARTGALTAFTLGVQDVATTGTASSGATVPASSLTDNNQTFAVNQHAGRKIEITSGTGAGQIATIVSNDAHKIIIASTWTTVPDSTSVYKIGENKDLRAGNVALRTGGDLSAAAINVTGNLALSSEGAGAKQTITLLNSSGQNILLRADGLTITNALTTPGVNVVLQPFTTTNAIGIHNATGSELPHQATTGGIDIAVNPNTLTVASAAGFAVGDTIVIAGAGPGGAALTTSISSIAGTTLSINDSASATVAGVAITNAGVGAGATNYSAALLNQFHPQANITVGGDSSGTFPPTFPVGITGTPRQSGNVFIGNDGALSLGARSLNVSTTGNIVAHNVGTVGNVALVAGGAGGITLEALNSTGTNLLFKADAFSMPGAAASYTTAAGVNVTLQPFTLTNSVGVHNAIDYHTNAVGNALAGSNLYTVNSTAGFAVGNTIDILGAGPGGATLSTTISALGPLITLNANAALAVSSVTVTIVPLIGATFTTTGTINAGTGTLIVASTAGISVGDTIKVAGAGAGGTTLSTTVNALPASSGILASNASTTATNILVGLASAKQTINTNYALDLLNKFNSTAAITVSGTSVSAGPSNTLTGNIHTGSDSVTGATPFDIGTRTLRVSTTGTIFTHTAATIATASSGTSGTVPASLAAWTPGATPTPGTGIVPGGGGTGGTGGGGTGGSGSSGSSGSGGPGTAGPSSDPTGGATGSATNPAPSTPSTPPGGGTTPPGTTPPGGGGSNPLPTPTTGPGDPGVIVIGYTPDPDPTTPPDPGTPDPGGPIAGPVPPDPGTPVGPITVDPGMPPDPGGPSGPIAGPVTPPGPTTPPDPTTPTGPIAGDPGVTPPDPTDPVTPPGPVAGDPGTPPDPGGPTGPLAGDPGFTPPDPTDPSTPGGPIAGDPGIVPPGPTDPGTPTGPLAGDPGTTPTPGGTDPGGPTGPVAGDPGTTTPGGPTPPGGPVAGDPGTTTPGTGGDPGDPGTPGAPPGGTTTVAGDPGSPPAGTPPGPSDPSTSRGPVAGGPGTPSSTDPGGSTPGGTGSTTASTGGTPGSTDPGTSTPGTTGTSTASTGATGGTTDPGGSTSGGTGTSTASSGSTGGTPGATDPSGTTTGSTGTSTASTGSTSGATGSTDPGGTTGSSGTSTASTGSTGSTTGGTSTSGSATDPASPGGGSGTSTASTGGSTDPGGTSGTPSASSGSTTGTTGAGGSGSSTTGSTNTASADGTRGTATSPEGGTTESTSNQASVECPPGTSAAASNSGGGAAGPCVAIGATAGNAKPAAKPAVTARVPAAAATAGNVAPATPAGSGTTSSGNLATAPASAKPAGVQAAPATPLAGSGNPLTPGTIATAPSSARTAVLPIAPSTPPAGSGSTIPPGNIATAPSSPRAAPLPLAPPTPAGSGSTINPGSIATAPSSPKPAALPIAPAAAPVQATAQAAANAAPRTSGLPAPVLAVQGDGVNLYRDGRDNGPGTPLR